MLAPAKINLYLNIVGKAHNGYHLLDTLITFIDIYDEITITRADRFSLEISGEFAHLVENNENNIISLAAKIMAQHCCVDANFIIKLKKNIPVGAGLGGGSSDCATTLILLNELLGAGFSKEKLSEIGVKLGADVPIFINRHAAFVSGIGEAIHNAENLPQLYAVLVYPNKLLSTKDVFVEFSKTVIPQAFSTEQTIGGSINFNQSGSIYNLAMQNSRDDVINFLQNKSNDLEPAAIIFLPEIQSIIAELSLLQGCQFARMSGSGSTCFAAFTDKEQAESAAKKLANKYPAYWVKAAKIISEY